VEAGTISIELLGVARLLARREALDLPVAGPVGVADLALRVAGELPALVGTVLTEDGAFLGGHVLSREGGDLLRDPLEEVRPGERILLLSLSAGG
jgi:hypothetical protein